MGIFCLDFFWITICRYLARDLLHRGLALYPRTHNHRGQQDLVIESTTRDVEIPFPDKPPGSMLISVSTMVCTRFRSLCCHLIQRCPPRKELSGGGVHLSFEIFLVYFSWLRCKIVLSLEKFRLECSKILIS